jgi:hypothetical protein
VSVCQQLVGAGEGAQLFEMLDRGKHEQDSLVTMGRECRLGREPAQIDALLTIDLRLLTGGQRGEEEVGVEARAYLGRRDPAGELH